MNDIAVFIRPADWHVDANCIGADPDIFFPEDNESSDAAKAICRACDVQVECLTDALNRNETEGIWGGLTPRQRRTFRHKNGMKNRPGPKLKPIDHGTRNGAMQHRRRGEAPCDACREAKRAYEYERRFGGRAAS